MDEYSKINGLKNLNNDAILELPRPVKGFTYNRSDLSPGILHVGVGNFHRAHQAWYIHRLFEKGLNFDWGIVGAGVCTFDKLFCFSSCVYFAFLLLDQGSCFCEIIPNG